MSDIVNSEKLSTLPTIIVVAKEDERSCARLAVSCFLLTIFIIYITFYINPRLVWIQENLSTRETGEH
jgi:hypothetical protein